MSAPRRTSIHADGDEAGATHIDRRAFLGTLPAAAALLAARPLCAADMAVRTPIDTVGIQLYTLRSLLAQDLEGTLARVAEIGFREVEFAGLYGRTAADMRALLDRTGLRAVSSHHSVRDVRENWSRVLADATTLGQGYVVVASIPDADRATGDALRRLTDDFNRAGDAARAAGLHFGYHNHDFEFQTVDGEKIYDVLLQRCDPALVVMEMDLFWMVNGGQDPLAYFTAHPGRFHLVHAKDRTADGAMVNVGSGTIDFRAILARAEQAGIRHWLVEHDRPASPLEDVRASFQYLRQLGS
jgi:sugar phosphate isomerase/epimerase